MLIINSNRHRTIRMKPNDVDSSNEQSLLNTAYNYKHLISNKSKPVLQYDGILRKLKRREVKFKVGDYVRISKYRQLFDKAYKPNWTTEIFKVRKVLYNTNPITYLLSDLQNEDIKGCLYAEELQLAKHPDIYLIEKIIRRKKGKLFVKWLGFGPEHNSWISERDEVL